MLLELQGVMAHAFFLLLQVRHMVKLRSFQRLRHIVAMSIHLVFVAVMMSQSVLVKRCVWHIFGNMELTSELHEILIHMAHECVQMAYMAE